MQDLAFRGSHTESGRAVSDGDLLCDTRTDLVHRWSTLQKNTWSVISKEPRSIAVICRSGRYNSRKLLKTSF
jgi:hypothetical protein